MHVKFLYEMAMLLKFVEFPCQHVMELKQNGDICELESAYLMSLAREVTKEREVGCGES